MNSWVQLFAVVSFGFLSFVNVTDANVFEEVEAEYYKYGHIDKKGEVKFEEEPKNFCPKVCPSERTYMGGRKKITQNITMVTKGTVVVADLIQCFFGNIAEGAGWYTYTKSPVSETYYQLVLDPNVAQLDDFQFWIFYATAGRTT